MTLDDIGMLPLLPLRFLRCQHSDRPFHGYLNRRDSHYLLLHRILVLFVRYSHPLPISVHRTRRNQKAYPRSFGTVDARRTFCAQSSLLLHFQKYSWRFTKFSRCKDFVVESTGLPRSWTRQCKIRWDSIRVGRRGLIVFGLSEACYLTVVPSTFAYIASPPWIENSPG